MQKEALSLEKEKHLNKDACLRVLLRANLMNSLQDTSLKRKLLTDCAGDAPTSFPRLCRESSWTWATQFWNAVDSEIGKLTMQLCRESYGYNTAQDKQEIIMKEGLSCQVNTFYAKDHNLIEEVF